MFDVFDLCVWKGNLMRFDTRAIRRVMLFVSLALVALSLGEIGAAKADELVLKCVKDDRNPVWGDIDFTYWIDLPSSRVLAASR